MNCAVITPIGPGHETLYSEARASVDKAVAFSKGPFENILHKAVDDTAGSLGRSAARNLAVREAAAANIDWIFFLDADDLLAPEAFERAAPLMQDRDAIWGAICEQTFGAETCTLRAKQTAPLRNIIDILKTDPFYSLQMGHFVRTSVAQATPFSTELNAGEDFDYFLRVWTNYRCAKIAAPLFINRRGCHSQGPKSATGADWRANVGRIMLKFLNDNKARISAIAKAP
jgi:glycosyltransferase involved in cell wall biosynthesis